MKLGWPTQLEIEAKLTIAPPPAFFMPSTACLVTREVPTTFTPSERFQSSTDASMPFRTKVAALFTKISTRPKAFNVSVVIFFAASSLEISALITRTFPFSFLISAAVFWAAAASISTTTTFAPSSAKRSAVERPMPEPAPVIIATLFFSLMFPPPGVKRFRGQRGQVPAFRPAGNRIGGNLLYPAFVCVEGLSPARQASAELVNERALHRPRPQPHGRPLFHQRALWLGSRRLLLHLAAKVKQQIGDIYFHRTNVAARSAQ